MKKLAGALAAMFLALLLALILAGALLTGGKSLAPSKRGAREIPADLMPLYQAAAATCEGMPWTLLAAIHHTETGFSRQGTSSSAGAQGPMQFMPATWSYYGVDGDGDGIARIDDVEDAVYGAARLLCANGAGNPSRLADAVFSYNHSSAYVDEVVDLTTQYGAPTYSSGAVLAKVPPADILRNSRITLSEAARLDVSQGVVDPRVLSILESISRRHSIAISVLKSGHSPYVSGTSSYSNHFFGRAVDIYAVDGQNVSWSNLRARAVTLSLGALPVGLRPDEVGSPFYDVVYPGAFTNADHLDHIHIGFDS